VEEHRDQEARACRRERAGERAGTARQARAAPRARARRRSPRRRILLLARAGEEQGDARVLRRRGIGIAAARLPLDRDVRAGTDLPGRRPRRSGPAGLAAADRGPEGVRRARGRARRRAGRSRPPRPPLTSTQGFRFFVVPHTHWDREWYLPLEHFRLELAGRVDDV